MVMSCSDLKIALPFMWNQPNMQAAGIPTIKEIRENTQKAGKIDCKKGILFMAK